MQDIDIVRYTQPLFYSFLGIERLPHKK